MIDFSKYMLEKYGVDDSGFAHPFGMVDEIRDTGEGPIIGITYSPGTPEEAQRNRDNLRAIAERIRDRVEGYSS